MESKIIDGSQLAKEIKSEIKTECEQLIRDYNHQPGLVVVHAGDDPASAIYIRNKKKSCEKAGIRSEVIQLPESVSTGEITDLIRTLNQDNRWDGILVQLPLPRSVDADKVIFEIDPNKDVDGFHPVNIGRLWAGRQVIAPCTPAGIIELLVSTGISLEGKHAVIAGRSNIVGKPLAALLLNKNSTVTVAHSRTRNLAEICSSADILVSAIGKPAVLDRRHIRKGAVVIDVGINRIIPDDLSDEVKNANPELKSKLISKGTAIVGDFNPSDMSSISSYFTPVPGGVGPMTIAMLLKNTLTLARYRLEYKIS